MKFGMLRAEIELGLNQGLKFHADLVTPFIWGKRWEMQRIVRPLMHNKTLTSQEGGSLGETIISRPSEKQTKITPVSIGNFSREPAV